MSKQVFLLCVVAAMVHVPETASAQFTSPRSYENTPAGTNQLELAYAYVHGNTSLDPSLIVAGASLDLNQATIDYTRYFGVFHRLMWAEAAVPVAGLSGAISGTSIQASAT